MTSDPTARILKLQAAAEALSPEDSMAEAGRKVLLGELIKVLSHEMGSRTDRDLEDVHQMRVAIRRIRSLFRLLRPYFKKGVIRQYNHEFADLAGGLGEVRDLDVLLENLRAFKMKGKLKDDTFQLLLNELERQRQVAREEWAKTLDSRTYQRTIKSFGKWVASPGQDVKALPKGSLEPWQIRHVLPGLIYNQLAAVRVYETVLDTMDMSAFHSLRIAFKRLRYLISLFEPLLGKQIEQFVDELKQVQDCLGEMHDCTAARDRLLDLPEAFDSAILAAYVAQLEARQLALRSHFFELWSRFNTRRVQQQLASAVLSLR